MSTEAAMADFTQRFVIGHGAVRGEYVRIGPAWRAMLARRAYPPSVTALLGECLAASALFTSTLKMLQDDGRLSIQIQQGKPVSMLVAECRADLSVRAMARVDPGETPADGASLKELIAGATFALTIDPGGDYDSYQSLVPIESNTLAETLNEYMTRSEQLASRFVLAANGETSVGLLVQRVPQQGGKADVDPDPDAWNRIDTLTKTATREEMLDLSGEEMLHRLFNQEEVRLMPARAVSFVCRCSKERVAGVLQMLGSNEVRGLLADRRFIEVDCDFCGQRYTFTAEEAWAALAP